jgi:hypothetical protein
MMRFRLVTLLLRLLLLLALVVERMAIVMKDPTLFVRVLTIEHATIEQR